MKNNENNSKTILATRRERKNITIQIKNIHYLYLLFISLKAELDKKYILLAKI